MEEGRKDRVGWKEEGKVKKTSKEGGIMMDREGAKNIRKRRGKRGGKGMGGEDKARETMKKLRIEAINCK